MKTIIRKTLVLPLLLSLLVSCNDFLTMLPPSDIVLENYWTEKADVEAVIASCYRSMIEPDFIKRTFVWGELRSDNIIAGKNEGTNESYILNANLLPTNPYSKWNNFYTVINYCNTVLKHAGEVQEKDPNFTLADLRAIEAEALALRSLCYFYLVRAFNNVPWVDQPTESDAQNLRIPQTPGSEVIEKIIKDLLYAEQYAMREYGKANYNKGRVTKNMVRALLADVYLWNQQYRESVYYCDSVINFKIKEAEEGSYYYSFVEGKYPLLSSTAGVNSSSYAYYMIFGSKNSFESIFELQFSTSTKNNDMIGDYYGSDTNPVGKFSVPPFIAQAGTVYKENDDRRKDFIAKESIDKLFPIFKYAGLERYSDSYQYRTTTSNWIVYRLTDVMLMKAEALAQLDVTEKNRREAFDLVVAVHNRSNTSLGNDTLALANYPDKRSLENLILEERQRELIFEGKRWFDLLRVARRDGDNQRLLDKVVQKYTENQNAVRSKISSSDALYFPVHIDEMKVNSSLEQNPAYLSGSSTH